MAWLRFMFLSVALASTALVAAAARDSRELAKAEGCELFVWLNLTEGRTVASCEGQCPDYPNQCWADAVYLPNGGDLLWATCKCTEVPGEGLTSSTGQCYASIGITWKPSGAEIIVDCWEDLCLGTCEENEAFDLLLHYPPACDCDAS